MIACSRIRRNPDQVEFVTEYMDPLLEFNQKKYHRLISKLKQFGLISFVKEPLELTRQRVAYALRERECFGKEIDPNQLLKATVGDGVNCGLATFEDIYDMLVDGPCASDAGPVKYPTGNWRRLSYECDAACKMHRGASTLRPSDDPD